MCKNFNDVNRAALSRRPCLTFLAISPGFQVVGVFFHIKGLIILDFFWTRRFFLWCSAAHGDPGTATGTAAVYDRPVSARARA